MALVIPYGDMNAHGSLGDMISFRRIRGGVVMEKKPRPKITNSIAQQAVRLAFKTANNTWLGYDPISKPYINARSVQLAMTPRNLFTKANLDGNLTPDYVLQGFEVASGQLSDYTDMTNANTQLSVEGLPGGSPPWTPMGTLDVETGIWTNSGRLQSYGTEMRIVFNTTLPTPFRLAFTMNFDDGMVGFANLTIRLPPGPFPGTYGPELWLDRFGTVYTDTTLAHWLATNRF